MQAVDRRMAMALGAAMLAPATLDLPPARAEMYARHAGIQFLPGIRRIELGHWPVSFLSYKSIMIADYIVEPGAGFPPERMKYDTIFHVLDGEFRVKANREFLVPAGAAFACAAGESKEDTNTGQLDAVMRVITLKAR